MCLDKIYKDHQKPRRRPTYAWKLFESTIFGTLGTPFQGTGICYEKGKWIRDTAEGLIAAWDGTYPMGYHAFIRKKDAVVNLKNLADNDNSDIVLHKVNIKNIVAYGEQYKCKIVVFREMYIGGKYVFKQNKRKKTKS